MGSTFQEREIAEGLTTAERIALVGPRKFHDWILESEAARGLIKKGLICQPDNVNDAAPLSDLGSRVLKHAKILHAERHKKRRRKQA